jgi:hypothetical protein
MDANKKLFFKNVFDSGIVEIWFKGVAYSLATAAFLYLAFNGNRGATVVARISYLLTGLQVIHGSRKPYEYLKEIYVYPQRNKLVSFCFYVFFLYFRIQIILVPIQILSWTQGTGKLPL